MGHMAVDMFVTVRFFQRGSWWVLMLMMVIMPMKMGMSEWLMSMDMLMMLR